MQQTRTMEVGTGLFALLGIGIEKVDVETGQMKQIGPGSGDDPANTEDAPDEA